MRTMLWRRLDAAGHDACRLLRTGDGWRLEGAAVFRREGDPACLMYEVECDGEWRTRKGIVRGWAASRSIDQRITRTPAGAWTLNGEAVSGLEGCVDLDLGFSPATNLFQLRRVAPAIGQAAEVPVAWLDPPAGTFEMLRQRYERRTAGAYWYEAPRFSYRGLLEVNAAGFIEKYPNLWESAP